MIGRSATAASALLDRTVIAGAAETEHVRGTDKSEMRLVLEASLAACRDADVAPESIDGLSLAWHQAPSSDDFVATLGIRDLRFHSHCRAGGASPVAQLLRAAAAIAAGVATRVIVALGWNAFSGALGRRSTAPVSAGSDEHSFAHRVRRDLTGPVGLTVPMQLYSLHANRWLHECGGSLDGMATIALTQRAHAQLNPTAFMRGRTLDAATYDAAPYLCTPLRLFDCCLETDGAAAVLVTGRDDPAVARRGGTPVFIAGGAEGHASSPGDLTTQQSILEMGITKAAPRAFAAAGLRHDEVDFAEIYDCFSFVALRQLEELGFCARGEGSEFVRDGRIALGGDLPVNTHGGLLSHSYVAGMTHITEAVRQLRGEAGDAQVENARIGLVTGFGNESDGALVFLHN